jgi:hypothetical protein
MNIRLLAALPLCVVAFYGSSQVIAQGACAPVETPAQCSGGQRITINNNSKTVSPRNLCARPGETITVNVTPNNTTAIVHGKDGGWPYATNGPDSSMFTLYAPEEGDYEYNITFQDGSCVDPRITVRR